MPRGYAIIAGTVSVTTAAGQVDADLPCRSVLLQADPDNGAAILIGHTAAQTIQLAAGDTIEINSVDNLNRLYAKSVSGTQTLNWLASQ